MDTVVDQSVESTSQAGETAPRGGKSYVCNAALFGGMFAATAGLTFILPNEASSIKYQTCGSMQALQTEVVEEVGTEQRKSDMIGVSSFDYIEESYTLDDLAQELDELSRGFTREEAEGYERFVNSFFV